MLYLIHLCIPILIDPLIYLLRKIFVYMPNMCQVQFFHGTCILVWLRGIAETTNQQANMYYKRWRCGEK